MNEKEKEIKKAQVSLEVILVLGIVVLAAVIGGIFYLSNLSRQVKLASDSDQFDFDLENQFGWGGGTGTGNGTTEYDYFYYGFNIEMVTHPDPQKKTFTIVADTNSPDLIIDDIKITPNICSNNLTDGKKKLNYDYTNLDYRTNFDVECQTFGTYKIEVSIKSTSTETKYKLSTEEIVLGNNFYDFKSAGFHVSQTPIEDEYFTIYFEPSSFQISLEDRNAKMTIKALDDLDSEVGYYLTYIYTKNIDQKINKDGYEICEIDTENQNTENILELNDQEYLFCGPYEFQYKDDKEIYFFNSSIVAGEKEYNIVIADQAKEIYSDKNKIKEILQNKELLQEHINNGENNKTFFHFNKDYLFVPDPSNVSIYYKLTDWNGDTGDGSIVIVGQDYYTQLSSDSLISNNNEIASFSAIDFDVGLGNLNVTPIINSLLSTIHFFVIAGENNKFKLSAKIIHADDFNSLSDIIDEEGQLSFAEKINYHFSVNDSNFSTISDKYDINFKCKWYGLDISDWENCGPGITLESPFFLAGTTSGVIYDIPFILKIEVLDKLNNVIYEKERTDYIKVGVVDTQMLNSVISYYYANPNDEELGHQFSPGDITYTADEFKAIVNDPFYFRISNIVGEFTGLNSEDLNCMWTIQQQGNQTENITNNCFDPAHFTPNSTQPITIQLVISLDNHNRTFNNNITVVNPVNASIIVGSGSQIHEGPSIYIPSEAYYYLSTIITAGTGNNRFCQWYKKNTLFEPWAEIEGWNNCEASYPGIPLSATSGIYYRFVIIDGSTVVRKQLHVYSSN